MEHLGGGTQEKKIHNHFFKYCQYSSLCAQIRSCPSVCLSVCNFEVMYWTLLVLKCIRKAFSLNLRILGKCARYGASWRGGSRIEFLSNFGSKSSETWFSTHFSIGVNTPTYGDTPKLVLVPEIYDKRSFTSTGKILNLSMKKRAKGHLKQAPDMAPLGGDGEIVSLAG